MIIYNKFVLTILNNLSAKEYQIKGIAEKVSQ